MIPHTVIQIQRGELQLLSFLQQFFKSGGKRRVFVPNDSERLCVLNHLLQTERSVSFDVFECSRIHWWRIQGFLICSILSEGKSCSRLSQTDSWRMSRWQWELTQALASTKTPKKYKERRSGMESIDRIRSLSRRIEMRDEESESKLEQRRRTMRVGAEFGYPRFDISLVLLALL